MSNGLFADDDSISCADDFIELDLDGATFPVVVANLDSEFAGRGARAIAGLEAGTIYVTTPGSGDSRRALTLVAGTIEPVKILTIQVNSGGDSPTTGATIPVRVYF